MNKQQIIGRLKCFLALVTLLWFQPAMNAHAFSVCECPEQKLPLEAQRARAFGVFTGTVKQINRRLNPDRLRVEFDVHQSWKGISNDEVVVHTQTSDPASLVTTGITCGFEFERGESYLVLSYRDHNARGPSWTSRCWNTKKLSEAADDVVRLGQPVWRFSAAPDIVSTEASANDSMNPISTGSIPLLSTTDLPKIEQLPQQEIQPYLLPDDSGVPRVQKPYLERQ